MHFTLVGDFNNKLALIKEISQLLSIVISAGLRMLTVILRIKSLIQTRSFNEFSSRSSGLKTFPDGVLGDLFESAGSSCLKSNFKVEQKLVKQVTSRKLVAGRN